MSLVKVTITIESPGGITSVSRQRDTAATYPGTQRPLVLPVLLSAVKVAAGPYLDEFGLRAGQLLADVADAVANASEDTP